MALTAMFAVCGIVLLAAGHALPEPWTWDWWTTRAGYLGVAAAVLAVLVTVTARAERWCHAVVRGRGEVWRGDAISGRSSRR